MEELQGAKPEAYQSVEHPVREISERSKIGRVAEAEDPIEIEILPEKEHSGAGAHYEVREGHAAEVQQNPRAGIPGHAH